MGLLNLREALSEGGGPFSTETAAPGQTPISQGMGQSPGLSVPVPGAEQAPQQGGGQDPQDIAEKMLVNISNTVFEDSTDSVLAFIKDQGSELQKNIGNASAELVKAQEGLLKSIQGGVPDGILFDVGAETVEMLTELAESAGLYQPASEEEEAQFMNEAAMHGSENYKQSMQKAGTWDQQAADQLGQQMQSGELDQMMGPE